MSLLVTVRRGLVAMLSVALILAMAALILDVSWGVISRLLGTLVARLAGGAGWEPWAFLPTGQAEWTEELARALLVWVALLGSCLAFGSRGHLGLDALVQRLHPSAQRFMAAVAQGLVALFAAGILIWGGGLLTLDTFRLRQTLPALGIPKGLVYLVAPISGGLTFIFAIEAILEAVSGHPEALPTVSPSDPADVAAAPVRPPPDGTQAS